MLCCNCLRSSETPVTLGVVRAGGDVSGDAVLPVWSPFVAAGATRLASVLIASSFTFDFDGDVVLFGVSAGSGFFTGDVTVLGVFVGLLVASRLSCGAGFS